MTTKHVVHVTQNGKNVRVEADSFDAAITALNVATSNKPFDVASMEHIEVLGE